MRKNNNLLDYIYVAIGMLLIIILLSTMTTLKDNNWAVPETACNSDYECIQYMIDCVSHVEPDYNWAADIKCLNSKCYCMSE